MSDERRPTARSAALRYEGVGAPRVIAAGEGELALRLRAVAEAHGVPLVEDQRLAELLCQIPLGDEIPETLYVSVAEVLAYVYRLEVALSERA